MLLAEKTLNCHSSAQKKALFALRALIVQTAKETLGVGPIEEALRWGQLSFMTTESGSGSTIRIDAIRGDPKKYAIFFNCQSGLIAEFRNQYPGKMQFVGERSIEFSIEQPLPEAELKHCISLALTHRLRKQVTKTKQHKK
jgi:Domain of unknown function (DU1801)